MTRDEINREVAEKVMKFKARHYGRVNHGCGDWSWAELGYYDEKACSLIVPRVKDWNPAECIEHAWMVVEKFLFVTLNGAPGRYTCRLISQYDDMGNGMWGTATTNTAPMAICLAALKAKEGE